MSEFVSVERIESLKSGIESKTGETYTDLTAGVQALVDGYGVGSEDGSGKEGESAFYQGTVIITSRTTSFKVPVDMTAFSYAIGYARVVKTGVIVDNEIVWDEVVRIPTASSSEWWAPIFISTNLPFLSTPIIYNNDLSGNIGSKSLSADSAYRVRNNNNGSSTGGGKLSISSNGVVLSTGSYALGMADYAVEYEYMIFGLCGYGIPYANDQEV